MKKIFVLTIVLVLVVTGLFATGTIAESRVKVRFWHMESRPTRVKALTELLEDFNKTHPDIDFAIEVQSWGEVYLKIVAAVMAGKEPDFMFTTPDFTTNVKMTGAVRPVTQEVEELKNKYHIYEPALGTFYWDGEYWSAPLYNMIEVLWYRPDLFLQAGLRPDVPPKTWSELLDYANKLVDSGAVEHPIAVPGDLHLATIQQIYPLMCVAGAADLFDEEGRVIFNNPNTVRAYDFYMKLFRLSPPGSETWQWDQPLSAFINGKVAMVTEKGHYIEQWELRSKLSADYISAAPVPIPDKNGVRAATQWMNGVMLLNPDKEARRVFTEFVDYLYQPDNMARLLTVAPGFFLPVTEEAASSDKLFEHPVVKKHKEKYELMIEQVQYGKQIGFTKRPYNPYIGRIMGQNIVAWVVQQMIYQNLSAEEAVRLGQEKILQAIE